MSDETNTAVETEAADEVSYTADFPGVGPLTLVSTKPRKKKNSEETVSYFVPQFPTATDAWRFLTKVIDDQKLLAALVTEIIKPAASEATCLARKVDPETGEPSLAMDEYADAFIDQFNPASRRKSGEGLKEINARLLALQPALMAAAQDMMAKPGDETAKNRMSQIVLEITELSAKAEARRRAPKAKAPKAAK